MGDRTWVTLTVRDEDVAAATAFFDDEDPEDDWESDGQLSSCQFDEVNYARLGFELQLQEAGIPYDKEWGRGDEYGPGTEYCRYTDQGELEVFDWYDGDENPDIDELIKRIDEPDKLRQFILDHKENYTPLSWDSQEHNVKLYRTRQLIAS